MHPKYLLPFALTILAACSSSDDGDDAGPAPDTGEALTTYIGFERRFTTFAGQPAQIGSLARGDKNFVTNSFSVVARADEGLELDYFGNAYQASDTPDLMATVRILGRVRDRNQAAATAVERADRDRDIGFVPDPFNPFAMDETTLVQPKSVALAHVGGYVIVADFGDDAVKVWGSAAGGNVAPLFASSTPAAPWDLAYDEPNDRLYVSLTDGTIAVFDAFFLIRPAAPSRIIQPSTNGTTQTTVHLRGLLHSTANGRDDLIVTDIGTEGNAAGRDGSIVQIEGASTAVGISAARALVRGFDSFLVDPSDVVLTPDGRLRVADPNVGRVSIFNPTTTGAGSQTAYQQAPALINTIQNANGIAVEPIGADRIGGVNTVEDPMLTLNGLIATTSPAGMNGELVRLDADLMSAPDATFDLGRPIVAATLDAVGDAFVTYAATSDPAGVGVVNRFATQRGTGGSVTFDPSRDRIVQSVVGPFDPPNPILDAAAVLVDDRADLLVFADRVLSGIWVYGRNAGPLARPTRILSMGFAQGVNEPGGMDYDVDSDTLYVATTSGAIFVYEGFVASPGDIPDRTITPSDMFGATQISTDLRSLVYDATRDVLIVSEAGATSGASNDGAIYVLEGASTASGLTPAVTTVTGASTMLDEPIDLAWNGGTLWVAENANGEILRFDDLLMLDGNVAPTASLALPDVSSVEINPAFLVPATGGSIHED